jgi:hypothetical protein
MKARSRYFKAWDSEGEVRKVSAATETFLAELRLACCMGRLAWERRNTFWDDASL